MATSPDALAALPSVLPAVRDAAVMPKGFRAGGAVAGVKASGRPDLGIVAVTGRSASAAAVFTRKLI
jgi:N-acetylglutamate synthase/N-acetylornithine aminotransferase